jgi:hypothetical protein
LADVSRTIHRSSPACIAATDVLVFGLAFGSIFEILFSDWELGDNPYPPKDGYPWMDSKDVALCYMAALTCVLSLLISSAILIQIGRGDLYFASGVVWIAVAFSERSQSGRLIERTLTGMAFHWTQ